MPNRRRSHAARIGIGECGGRGSGTTAGRVISQWRGLGQPLGAISAVWPNSEGMRALLDNGEVGIATNSTGNHKAGAVR